MSALGHKRTFVGAIEMSAPLKRLTTGLGENLLSLLVASETFTWLTQMFLPVLIGWNAWHTGRIWKRA
jgi:hypothetical protein